MCRGPGEQFQEETRYSRRRAIVSSVARPVRPSLYKHYASAPRVNLPSPPRQGSVGVFDATSTRRSVRAFGSAPLTLVEVGAVLFAGAGITANKQGMACRAAPSAGALYPIETYLVVHSVKGLAPGLYHHAVEDHSLEQLRCADLRAGIVEAGGGQRMLGEAGMVLVWTAVIDRCRSKYLERAWRYVYLDAGHVAAHVSLAAVALELGSCQVGAFYDDDLADLVGVDLHGEPPLYLTAVGRPS